MHYRLFSKYTQHLFIVIVWVVIAVICAFYLPHAGNPFKIENINDPRADSTIAQKKIENKFSFSGSRVFLLYKSKTLTTDNPQFESAVNKSLAGAKKFSFEHRIISPFENTNQISKDKHAAYAVIETNLKSVDLARYIPEINKLPKADKLQMYSGGEAYYTADVNRLSEENLRRGELIALPLCLIAMIFIFNGFLPALLTIIVGIINVTIIITILYLLAYKIDLTIFVLNIATMLGLGLSLDYTLLITYRFREEYSKCLDCGKTIMVTLSTAGKSVLFSGTIFLISIASLIFFPINILFSMGVGGIVVVIVTILSSTTLLPASLCLFERFVTRTNISLQHLTTEDVHSHRWYHFTLFIMKYPFTFLIPAVLILLLLGYPFLNVKINISDAKILPTWTASRQLLDKFEENFNPNELTPIYIVFTAKNKSILSNNNISALYDFANSVKKDSRVKRVNSIVTLKDDLSKKEYQQIYSSSNNLPFNEYQKKIFKSMAKDKYTIMSIISKYPKDDKRNLELIDTLRQKKIGNGITRNVGGNSAEIIDTMDSVFHLFIKMTIVITIFTYLVLLLLLRSIILPLKAIIMNFLSLSVCYGMLVFIFQEGYFAKLLGFKALNFTDLNLPILIFFVLFGLSMDYEVFLLSRVKEFYDKTHDNVKSVALGVERSARIISSAALVLVIVTTAFVTADIVFIKAFGLATALGIAIDASMIRLLLVPTTMTLLGKWNWYCPKWLQRILPKVKFD